MPQGYLVTLGNNSLDPADVISGGLFDFDTQTALGAGQWQWTGTWNGSQFTNELEPGQYYLATNGNVYFEPGLGPVTTLTSGSVISAPSFTLPDGIVSGNSGADLIDNSYTDSDLDQVDDNPAQYGDDIRAGAGNDTVMAGLGDDTVDGGSGNDEIHGDFGPGSPTLIAQQLNWDALGGNGTNLAAGVTQDTGDIDVSVSFANTGDNAPVYQVNTSDQIYVAGGEPYDNNSSLYLFGNGDGATSTTTIDFAASAGADVADAVQNLNFRINDIDWGSGNHTDIVTVNAYDADGNPVTVTLTPSGGDSVSGTTITANQVANSPGQADGSVLVEIAGPVAQVEIIYANGQSGTQAIWVSDLHFDAVPEAAGNDDLSGGLGDDTIYGEAGDDTLSGDEGADSLVGGSGADDLSGGAGDDTLQIGSGDSATGGDGDDLFIIEDTGDGPGSIILDGGTTGQGAGDVLDLNGLLAPGSVNVTSNIGGEKSGTAQLLDGTTVNFSNIDSIICYATGTRILTDQGYRAIETLRPGDGIVTEDAGVQPLRWLGQTEVIAQDDLAAVRIDPGVLPGALRPLIVSQRHRMVLHGYLPELMFGTDQVFADAGHLVDLPGVTRMEGGTVTYVHLALARHHVIWAEGMASESFFAGPSGLAALGAAQRADLLRALPQLQDDPHSYGAVARPCLHRYETEALMEQMRGQTLRPLVA
jgi:Ca2+-binding RTX toxin-like protein